jgi:hypothetical protein
VFTVSEMGSYSGVPIKHSHGRHRAPRQPRLALWASAAVTGATAAVGVLPGVAAASVARPAASDAVADSGVRYPAGASATRFTGLAFDACDAPSVATMRAWRSSPYGALGVYTSGGLRACSQRNLDDAWVRDVSALGWKLIPIDVGLQAPCSYNSGLGSMSRETDTARAQGAAAAKGAVAAARDLDILPGSALYADLEPFRYGDAECVDAVGAYLAGWTRTLHHKGYLAGAYGDTSLVRTQAAGYDAGARPRLDAVWSARWDGAPSTRGWVETPDERWAAHQRLKQFHGDHDETHGGATINIDSNVVDAPVATVARAHILADVSIPRAQPDEYSRGGAPLAAGSTARLVCRVDTPEGGWSKLTDGAYLALSATPTAKPKQLPVCTAPYQVTADTVSARADGRTEGATLVGGVLGGTAPRSAIADGVLPAGRLTWATCEAASITSGDLAYRQRLDTGEWIDGHLTSAPDPFSRSPALPLC